MILNHLLKRTSVKQRSRCLFPSALSQASRSGPIVSSSIPYLDHTELAARFGKKQKKPQRRETGRLTRGVVSQPKKNSPEWKAMQAETYERKRAAQGKKDGVIFGDELTPIFTSAMIFGAAVPQSILTYSLLWNDPCSDIFLQSAEMAIGWIAVTNALEGAAGVGLGYIDYKIKGNGDDMLVPMRKKRLAFAKFSFMMAIWTLYLLEGPTANCVLPLIIGCGWNTMKMGTQIGYNLTPERFFLPRTFLSVYNLVFLIILWYKMRQSRKDKLDLEFGFFQRVEGIMVTMTNIFQDDKTFQHTGLQYRPANAV